MVKNNIEVDVKVKCINLLAFVATDCMNSEGLYIQANARETGPAFYNTGTNPGKTRARIDMLSTLVAQNCATVEDAVSFIKNELDIYSTPVKDEEEFTEILTPTATAVAAIYLGYSIGFGKSFYAKMTDETALIFKAMPITDGIGTLFVIVSFVGICYYLTALLPGKVKTWFTNTSNDITRIYVIHWLILNSFVYFVVLPMGALPGLLVYPCTVVLFVVSSLLARLLKNKKQGLLL